MGRLLWLSLKDLMMVVRIWDWIRRYAWTNEDMGF